eukprot:scaffold89066_cov31-Tisochrysis_lutea.AAC.1
MCTRAVALRTSYPGWPRRWLRQERVLWTSSQRPPGLGGRSSRTANNLCINAVRGIEAGAVSSALWDTRVVVRKHGHIRNRGGYAAISRGTMIVTSCRGGRVIGMRGGVEETQRGPGRESGPGVDAAASRIAWATLIVASRPSNAAPSTEVPARQSRWPSQSSNEPVGRCALSGECKNNATSPCRPIAWMAPTGPISSIETTPAWRSASKRRSALKGSVHEAIGGSGADCSDMPAGNGVGDALGGPLDTGSLIDAGSEQLNVRTSWKKRREPIWPHASPVKKAKAGVRGNPEKTAAASTVPPVPLARLTTASTAASSATVEDTAASAPGVSAWKKAAASSVALRSTTGLVARGGVRVPLSRGSRRPQIL